MIAGCYAYFTLLSNGFNNTKTVFSLWMFHGNILSYHVSPIVLQELFFQTESKSYLQKVVLLQNFRSLSHGLTTETC